MCEKYPVENMHKIDGLPRYHVTNPLEKNDLSHFKLSNELLNTYMDKIEDGKKELMLRGNNLELRMGRRIRDSDLPYLLKFLHFNPEVTSLDLAYNELTNAGLHVISDYLEEHDGQLLKLNVMCNDIDWRGIVRLSALGENLSLHSLRVNGNKFGPEGGKALALLLACNPCLRHLDVGDTDQDVGSLAYFTTMLRWDHSINDTLEMLDLSRPNGPWNYQLHIEHMAETIGQMLKYNYVLRELHLQKYGFSDQHLELMLLGLKENRTLRLLDLSCNNIGCDGAKLIGDYLATRPALLGLMLGHNQINDIGARSLSFTLPYSRIKLLDLSHNQLTDEGFLDILNSIKKPVILRCLYVWGNKITHNSLMTLITGLVSTSETEEYTTRQSTMMTRWTRPRQIALVDQRAYAEMVLGIQTLSRNVLWSWISSSSQAETKNHPTAATTASTQSRKRIAWTDETRDRKDSTVTSKRVKAELRRLREERKIEEREEHIRQSNIERQAYGPTMSCCQRLREMLAGCCCSKAELRRLREERRIEESEEQIRQSNIERQAYEPTMSCCQRLREMLTGCCCSKAELRRLREERRIEESEEQNRQRNIERPAHGPTISCCQRFREMLARCCCSCRDDDVDNNSLRP